MLTASVRWLSSAIVVLALLIVSGCGSEPADLVDTRGKAREALNRDKEIQDSPDAPLVLWEYPALPYSAQQITYIKLLKSELGVDTLVMDLPKGVTDPEFRKQVNKHNEAARLRIEAKHGQGALGRLRQKANDEWEAKARELQGKSREGSGK
jgi:hypothetical protein